jgi:hypothetical protein
LAIYESTFRDTSVLEWTFEEGAVELTARLQLINLG